MQLKKMAAMLIALLLLAGNSVKAAESVLLKPGDYRLESQGMFRRIVISNDRHVSYDLWEVARNGKGLYLHFALAHSGSAQSAEYVAYRRGENCGSLSLRVY